ncbi:MAG TPA: cysteine rich repeat-containing protein [Geobacteraceae bacterium]|nr:cysteine rich repeat-containing protein [Geobacteraceae bacterium]
MMRAKWNVFFIPALLMTGLLSIQAIACAAEPAAEKPCMDEIEKFCKDFQPGEGKIVQCLRDHDRELSASCRDKVKVVVRRLEKAKCICAKDIEKFCAGVKPGGGRLIQCLKPHMDELTPACREELQSFTAKGSALKKSVQ